MDAIADNHPIKEQHFVERNTGVNRLKQICQTTIGRCIIRLIEPTDGQITCVPFHRIANLIANQTMFEDMCNNYNDVSEAWLISCHPCWILQQYAHDE